MTLDLGALRIAVEVDQSQVRPGLTGVRQVVAQATRQLAQDTDRAGRQAGEALAQGVQRAADGRLRDARGKFVASGKTLGSGLADGATTEADSRLQRWAGRAGYRLGSGIRGGVSSGLRSAGGLLAGGARDVERFATRGVAALGAVAVAGAAYGASVASSNEQAILSFQTMLRKGDDTAAKAHARAVGFVGDLQKFAAQTPFEFADLQKYSGQLVSAGIDADKIIPIMRNLGDVTAGVGTGAEGIDRATVALQQMIAAQKISAEDLNQLRDAGIPVYDLLAGATGKSKKEIVDLAQQGKLGKKELDQLLDTLSSKTPKGLERFSGLMDKQSTTLKGQLSNLADTASQGLGRIVTRGMPVIKRGVKEVGDTLGEVFDYFDDHKDDLGRIFRSGGRVIDAFGRAARPVLKAFFGSLSDGQDTLTSLADWMDTHEADMVGFFTGAAHAAISFGKVVVAVVVGVLRTYATLQHGIQAVLEFILSKTQDVAGVVGAVAHAAGLDGLASQADQAYAAIQKLRDNNRDNNYGDAADRYADSIEHGLLPALNKAGDALDDYSAKAQDAAKRGDVWRGSLIGISRAVRDNGKSLSEHTARGRANRAAVQASIDALREDAEAAYRSKAAKGDLAGAEKAAAKVIRNGTQDIKDQSAKAGLNKTAVGKMTDSLKDVPSQIRTSITFSTNAGKVLVRLTSWSKKYDASYSAAQQAAGHGSSSNARGGMAGRFMGQLPGRTPLSVGDDMALPLVGGGRQHLRGGEGVQVTEAMDPYEQRRLTAMNHGVLSGMSAARVRQMLGEQTVGRAARGGIAGSAVPASVMQLGPAATRAAQEWAQATAAAYATQTRKTLQGVADYNSGGNTGAAVRWGKAHAGHPYVFGTLWDCSGFVSALHSIARGESPHRRYVTPDFHGSHAEGFTRGKRSNFMVGVNPSPGKSGHMAATINGINFESAGGVGTRWGPSARGYDSSMFSWRGGLAYGGRVAGGVGDMPFDLISQRGQHYSPVLSSLAEVLAGRRGYADGTGSARAGFAWTAEKEAELVVNPSIRRYSGGERVTPLSKLRGPDSQVFGDVTINAATTRDALDDLRYKVRTWQVGQKRTGTANA